MAAWSPSLCSTICKLPLRPTGPQAAVSGPVRAEEILIQTSVGCVHDRQRGKVELTVRNGLEDLPEVRLAQTVAALVQRYGFDVDRKGGVDPVGERVVVVDLGERVVELAIPIKVGKVPFGVSEGKGEGDRDDEIAAVRRERIEEGGGIPARMGDVREGGADAAEAEQPVDDIGIDTRVGHLLDIQVGAPHISPRRHRTIDSGFRLRTGEGWSSSRRGVTLINQISDVGCPTARPLQAGHVADPE